MQSSNPLLVVGISAAIAIGSTTAATAKTESPADLEPVDSKENNAFEVRSLKPEPTEQWLLSQTNESPQDEVDIDLNLLDDSHLLDDSEPSSSDADLAQEPQSSPEPSLEESEAEAEAAIGEELEGEASEEGLPALPEGDTDVEIEAIEEDLPEAEAEGEAEVEAEEPEPVTDDEAEAEVEESSEESEEVEGEAEPVLETDPALEEDTLEPLPDIDSTPTTDEEPTPSDPTADPGSAPDYLDPDPNPLSFPTDPSEVEIIGTQPITLIQAIELGIRNNEDLQRARLELQRSQAALRETQAENFPTVDLGADLTLQGSEQPDTQFNPLTGEQEADGTELQTSLGLGGALQANYAIFTSGRRSALIQAAEREVRFQELAVESTTEDLILQVTQSYYDLQEADEQVQIFQAALDEAERSLRDAEALERAGVGTQFDVLQAQVDVANAQQDLRNQLSQQEVARRRLVEQLNLSQSVTLAAAEPVEVAGVWDLTLEQSIVEAFRNRAELEQQLVQREIAERNRRASLATLGPQVNLSAQYGLNNTLASDPDSIAEDFGFLSSFQVQLGVSISLFDGGRARAQARQAEANIAIAESQFANVRDQIRLEVEEAYSQLDANFENIQTTALAVQQAEEALRLARLRFQAGVGTQTDVLRSQTELTRSRFNNLQAILNYNRALAALRRSVSNFPEGYLNEVP